MELRRCFEGVAAADVSRGAFDREGLRFAGWMGRLLVGNRVVCRQQGGS